MKKCLFIVLILFIATPIALAQVPSASPSPGKPAPVQQREGARFEVSEYGISFQADTRLIIMMAALEAAGLDAQPGREPSVFRAKVRKDLASLDPDPVSYTHLRAHETPEHLVC